MAVDERPGDRAQRRRAEREARALVRHKQAEERRSRAVQQKLSTRAGRRSLAGSEAARGNAATKARYQNVVRAAQARQTNDPLLSRIDPGPAATRHRGSVDRFSAAPVGLLLFGDPDVQRGFRDTRDLGRAALDLLQSDQATGQERLAAASQVGAAIGALGNNIGIPRGRNLGSRTVRYGDSETQFPSSPSWVTAKGQRLLDRASERLAGRVDVLRESDRGTARAVGAALTPASARGRVPKQAGKLVRQEAVRDRAAMAQDVRTVKRVGRTLIPRREVPRESAAHFWYAQLPREYRNQDGLAHLRAAHIEDMNDLIAQGAAKEDIQDLATAINKLDDLIRNPVSVKHGVVDALRALDEDRAETLIEAGLLDPAEAEARRGIVNRWLGFESSGDEAFLGHREGRVLRQRTSGLPGNVATGKTLAPQGAGRNQQNQLKRVRKGRVRQDVDVAVEDWQAAQVYKFHNLAKDELGRMGRAYDGRIDPATEVLVNPNGHKVPRELMADPEARALQEGFADAEAIVVRDAEEYLRNYLGEGAAIPPMVSKAERLGQLDGLRVVPKDVVRRYYSQFLPTKIVAATPGVKATSGMVGRVADIINDALYASLIYSNPGYIPANTAANLILGVAQQGAFLPANLARSGQLLTHGPRKVRDLVRAEVGHGPTAAIASETSPLRTLATGVGRIADEPHRVSAFLFESARQGVIPKVRMTLTDRDYRKLEQLLTDPKQRPLLNDIRDRAEQAMIDFNRLGSQERAYAKRLLFVWSFLRGAARYPVRFAADHPLRSAALAAAAYAGQDKIRDATADEMPPWLEGSINIGEKIVDGKTFPTILPTRSFSPFSTPLELAQAATGQPGAQTGYEFLNPGLRSAARVLDKRSPFGAALPSYREALVESARQLEPFGGVTSGLVEDRQSGLYPEDATALGLLKRKSRVFPIAVDPEAAAKARRRERGERTPFASKVGKAIREEQQVARRLGVKLPPRVRDAIRLRETMAQRVDNLLREQKQRGDTETPAGEQFKLTQRQKLAAELTAVRDVFPGGRQLYPRLKQALDRLPSEAAVEAFRAQLKRDLGLGVVADWRKESRSLIADIEVAR